MNIMLKLLAKISSLFFILVLLSCSNSESENPPVDIPQDYIQFGTPFTNMPSNEDIVMYEVNIRAFSPEGNLQGVINKLNHIKSLGTNVIWLMPIHPVGQVNSINSPYCIKDYKSVGSEYGTLEDLRNLTTQAHQMGMAVILDWVANHTAWDHPWISSNPEWYTQNASGQIVHPPGTNWTDVADLNFNNQQMRTAMIDAMRYWVLEANVDGFRCDYADGVPFAFWNQAINHFKSSLPNRKVLWFAEGNRNDHFFAGFDLNFGWNFYGSLVSVWNGGSATQLYNTHIADYSNAFGNKQVLRFTTNHDESAWDVTPMIKFNGKKGAMAASVATIFMGGVPLFYSSQEVGRISNLPFFSNQAIDWTTNPDMLSDYQTMMQAYKNSNAARKGVLTHHSSSNIIAFHKKFQEEEILIIVNPRNSVQNFNVPNVFINTLWSNAMQHTSIQLQNQLSLNAYDFLILTKN